jgi:hypothetical protein
VDLETLKRYTRGELTPKQFLSVHRDASELLELLHQHLHSGEYVTMVTDWPAVRPRRMERQYLVLKTMMLFTPLVLVGCTAFIFQSPLIGLTAALVWLALFSVIAAGQLVYRARLQRSREGRSVVVVTDHRLMRVWLDGSGDVQSWVLTETTGADEPIEAVPDTVRLLLQVDLGRTSLN